MKTKIKRIIASVLVGATMLTSMPIANSYVLPVVDGAKMMQDAINWAMDAADRAMTLSHWAEQLQTGVPSCNIGYAVKWNRFQN